MAKPEVRIAAIQFCLAAGIGAIVVRAAQLQLFEGARWSSEAEAQRTVRAVLPARRGTLYDRNGVPLAVTQEFYHVGAAPNELRDRPATVRLLSAQLGLSAGQVDRDVTRKKWVYWHGPFTASQVQRLRGVAGVHLDGEFLRFYPARDLARPIIGGLSPDTATGASGLELALDSTAHRAAGRGRAPEGSRRTALRLSVTTGSRAGRRPRRLAHPRCRASGDRGARPGGCAGRKMRAAGGDVVFLDPATR